MLVQQLGRATLHGRAAVRRQGLALVEARVLDPHVGGGAAGTVLILPANLAIVRGGL